MLQHHHDDGIDLLGTHLRRGGLDLDVVAVHDGDAVPVEPDHDALVVLGGEMDVWQEDLHPWLADEKALLRWWAATGRGPLLGIRLGHQLLADALGGVVGPRAVPEAGVTTVRRLLAATGDPLIGPLGEAWPVLQWHGAEVQAPPPGATVLATNDACVVQAMRVGRCWWGVQFHPEVGPDAAARWGREDGFAHVLSASGGPGALDAFPGELAGARHGLDVVAARLAASLVTLAAGAPPRTA